MGTIKNLVAKHRFNRRAFFTLEDGVSAVVTPQGDNSRAVPVKLLSISQKGLSFLGVRYKLPELHPGDPLTIKNIKTPLPLGTIESLEAKVKYVVDPNQRTRLAYGCQFTKVTRTCSQKIYKFVKDRIHRTGLNGKKK
jgi:hypothetical protein